MFGKALSLSILLLGVFGASASADLCAQWSAPKQIGLVNTHLVPEASGMVFSRQFKNRVYLHNDSGNGPYFYLAAPNGSNTQTIEVSGIAAIDMEDIGYGPCGRGRACIYLADIGDNKQDRASVSVSIIEELANFPKVVQPLKILTLRYPDGPHNAEALAVHPNGDIYIVTKERSDDKTTPYPARLFKVPATVVATATGPVVPQFLGFINVPQLLGTNDHHAIVTGMDISWDGKKFILLTYLNAIEFNIDLATVSEWSGNLAVGRDYSVIPLAILQQQEAIAYFPDASGFLYTTEIAKGKTQPIVGLSCLKRQ